MLNIYFQDFVWFYLMEDLKTDTRTGARYYIKKDPCPRHGFYLPRGSLQTIFFDGEDFWSPFLESPICNQIHTFYDFDLYHVQGRDHLWGNLCRWQKIVACRCQTTKEHTFQEWEEKQFLLKKKNNFWMLLGNQTWFLICIMWNWICLIVDVRNCSKRNPGPFNIFLQDECTRKGSLHAIDISMDKNQVLNSEAMLTDKSSGRQRPKKSSVCSFASSLDSKKVSSPVHQAERRKKISLCNIPDICYNNHNRWFCKQFSQV